MWLKTGVTMLKIQLCITAIFLKIYAYKWQNQTIVNGNVTLIYKNKYIFIKKDYVKDL